MKEQKNRKPFQVEGASLTALLGRCGYIVDKKCGKQRGQRRILDILLCHPDMSQNALQQMLEIKAGSMSEIIAKMEAKGLITRERDERDRRKMVLCLTEEGKAAARQQAEEPQEDEIFQVLTEEERLQLKEMLTRLLVQWRKEREADINDIRKEGMPLL